MFFGSLMYQLVMPCTHCVCSMPYSVAQLANRTVVKLVGGGKQSKDMTDHHRTRAAYHTMRYLLTTADQAHAHKGKEAGWLVCRGKLQMDSEFAALIPRKEAADMYCHMKAVSAVRRAECS